MIDAILVGLSVLAGMIWFGVALRLANARLFKPLSFGDRLLMLLAIVFWPFVVMVGEIHKARKKRRADYGDSAWK